MKKSNEIIYLIIILAFLGILIYAPHIVNPFPIHIDEWHHISQSQKLKNNEYQFNLSSLEIGFHIFLLLLSFFIDLVWFYQFLPLIWTILTAIVLYLITKELTKTSKHSIFISLFTILFFASIKSNVNILGLWFFTPLTFALPFIFSYIFFFTRGIEKNNKKYLLISLIIIIFLCFTHAISFLFSFYFLIIYSIINRKKIIKNYKYLLPFLLIPIIGLTFFLLSTKKPIIKGTLFLLNELLFKYGWGVLEINNSFFETYSPIGYILATIGLIFLIINKKTRKKYLIYILWPILLLIQIIIFKITGYSFLSPYQRNLYYFTISLPFLSAFGLYFILKFIKSKLTPKLKPKTVSKSKTIQKSKTISKLKTIQKNKKRINNKNNSNNNKNENHKMLFQILKIILIMVIILLAFKPYFSINKNLLLYKTIDREEYDSILFLKNLPDGIILPELSISPTIYPITNKHPIGSIFFGGKRDVIKDFFNSENCTEKNNIIKNNKARYIISREQINCSWKIIHKGTNNNITIYEPIFKNN